MKSFQKTFKNKIDCHIINDNIETKKNVNRTYPEPFQLMLSFFTIPYCLFYIIIQQLKSNCLQNGKTEQFFVNKRFK